MVNILTISVGMKRGNLPEDWHIMGQFTPLEGWSPCAPRPDIRFPIPKLLDRHAARGRSCFAVDTTRRREPGPFPRSMQARDGRRARSVLHPGQTRATIHLNGHGGCGLKGNRQTPAGTRLAANQATVGNMPLTGGSEAPFCRCLQPTGLKTVTLPIGGPVDASACAGLRAMHRSTVAVLRQSVRTPPRWPDAGTPAAGHGTGPLGQRADLHHHGCLHRRCAWAPGSGRPVVPQPQVPLRQRARRPKTRPCHRILPSGRPMPGSWRRTPSDFGADQTPRPSDAGAEHALRRPGETAAPDREPQPSTRAPVARTTGIQVSRCPA